MPEQPKTTVATPESGDLAVRLHTRHECELSAQVFVAADEQRSLALSRAALGAGGALRATLTDCSEGGLGLRTEVFLPRNAPLRVVVPCPGLPGAPPLFDGLVRVRRVRMVDRAPTYYIGAAYEAGDASGAASLLNHASTQDAKGGARA